MLYYIEIFGGGADMDVKAGDTILVKKPHPCGGREFLVLRVGMDFKIKCKTCSREIMLPRSKIEKNIKKIIGEEQTQCTTSSDRSKKDTKN